MKDRTVLTIYILGLALQVAITVAAIWTVVHFARKCW